MGLDRFKDLTPTSARVLTLPTTHRYRGCERYEDGQGREFYGSRVPRTLPQTNQDRYYTVHAGVVGQLPIISFEIYGTAKYWWMLAEINEIFDANEEVVEGMELRYPPPALLFQSDLVRLV